MNETTMQRLAYDRIKTRVFECAFSLLGKHHAASMLPITDIRTIRTRLNETNEALQLIRHGASVPIPSLEGMEHILHLLGTGYLFSERDFFHITQFIRSCSQLIKYMVSKADCRSNRQRLCFLHVWFGATSFRNREMHLCRTSDGYCQ